MNPVKLEILNAQIIHQKLRELRDDERALKATRFFKTDKGQYGEGDQFLGIRVPVLRALVKQCINTPLDEIKKVLASNFHEERLFALFLLVRRFEKGDEALKKEIFDLYLTNTGFINSWDLVDSSAYQIIGAYLYDKDRSLLYQLVASASLWERRIAMMATYFFIKRQQYQDTLLLAEILLKDNEDLIHKVVGWMLREVGNKDKVVEIEFLQQFYKEMPRTMLRYAIEKFPEEERQQYLKGMI